MRIASFLSVITACFAFSWTPLASARGPFGLFSDAACCDSACDTCACDSTCCDADECDSFSDRCCESGCDTGCGGRDCLDRRFQSHALENLFRRDCCSCTYVSLLGGWNGLDDYNGNDFEVPVPPPSPAIRRGSFNDGWTIGAAGGLKFNQAIRGELEFAFRSNTASEWFVNGNPAGDWSGHFYSYSIMANLFHDFSKYSLMGWTPHVGGGIGIAFLDGEFETSTLDLEIKDEEFAYQLIAGGSKSLTAAIDLVVEYRYFATTDFDLVNKTPAPPVQFGEDPYEAHNVFVGFRLFR